MQTPTTGISDEHILALLSQESSAERGFRLLTQQYQERLYWHIRRMVVEHDDANDVLQNCLIKVFRSIHQFEGKSKLFTWLYRIATNEAITFLQQKQKRTAASIDDDEQRLTGQLQADPYFDGDDLQVKLQEALDKLPDKQRQVFLLRYYDEMGYKEMSELLDTSEGALKASFHHAVKKIEAFVKGVEIE